MIDITNKILMTAVFLSFMTMVISGIFLRIAAVDEEVGFNVDNLKLIFGFSFIIFVFTFIIGMIFLIWIF